MLFGAKSVLSHLSDKYGMKLTRHSLWRLSQRGSDPFPLFRRKRLDANARPRVTATSESIEKWMRRNTAWRPPCP